MVVGHLYFLISLYGINARTKKWPVRVLFHVVDFALAISWLEYCDHQKILKTPKKLMFPLLSFRESVVEAPIHVDLGQKHIRSVGRLLLDQKFRLPTKRPGNKMRYRGCDHWPEHIDEIGQHSKLEECNGHFRGKCIAM